MTEDQQREERELRIKCIELVVQQFDEAGERVIDSAQKYYWFITAKDNEVK